MSWTGGVGGGCDGGGGGTQDRSADIDANWTQ